jgi:hypothetical protein
VFYGSKHTWWAMGGMSGGVASKQGSSVEHLNLIALDHISPVYDMPRFVNCQRILIYFFVGSRISCSISKN